MLHILHGEDDFSIRESLAKIKSDCGGSDLGEANLTFFDGNKTTLNELSAACNTISFLASKRLVIVEGLLGRFERKAKRDRGKPKSIELKDWEKMPEVAANMPESTDLVLVEGKINKTNPLLKKLVSAARVRECVPPQGKDLHDWIRLRVSKNKCEIAPQATRLLADLIGSNLWILANEIEKLCLHANGQRIETSDINLLVSYARESSVFTMVDAIVQRRLEVASRLMHQILNEGAAPSYLLFMITRQFRLLIQAKSLIKQKVPANLIGKKIGLTSDFVLGKTMDQARGYSTARMEETYRKLLSTDLSIKTGAMDGEVALDLLITDLCKA